MADGSLDAAVRVVVGTPGRLPHYPPWVQVLHKTLAGVLGSHSKAARAMAHPAYWRSIRHHAAAHNAPKARRCPPQRWHHNYAQHLLDEHADQLLGAFQTCPTSKIFSRRNADATHRW